ncbi:MAG: tRNA 2-selenouridine(34) synthase MnmH [Cyclobacteriaceae bacterium]|nr:tRNA 2-selenouridine(34) synthase MnmH [Cyclobacteriaceae bacterium]
MAESRTISIGEFFNIRNQLPVVDVRAESEYAQGHIPGARNIPLLNDAERKEVGTLYKQKGQAEAIRAGFRLVGPRLLDMVDLGKAAALHNELVVHCWRGGMRSANFSQFVGMAGVNTWVLQGGYKAYRQEAVTLYGRPLPIRLIGGQTGTGKSEVLRALQAQGEQILDLEMLASHKGSTFGGLTLPPQPTNESFQNLLFEELRKLDPARTVWVEDESMSIGHVFIPEQFFRQMSLSPIIELKLDRAERIRRLVNEYGVSDPAAFVKAMEKIVKRLGGQNFNAAMDHVLAGNWPAAIDILLHYYDKAYQMSFVRHQNFKLGEVEWTGQDAHQAAQHLIELAGH